ncbi:hypothetical protein EV182_004105 [Spiromyces aspiralis]|uniref:Uncharacterized protein n=1 Tax=Spiromyces aspiralis TaxID=68401 RepID=A0ACC1HRM3_9FUNG|nr:hypothetical protein EV182_004105 [Spiromyces aspiralis]
MDLDEVHRLCATELLPCLKCLRSAYKAAANHAATVPLDVGCQFTEAGSSRCSQCNKRKESGCDPAPAGMVGDCLDLIIMVRSAHVLCMREEGQQAEGDDEVRLFLRRSARRHIAKVTNSAVAAFLAAELAHRRQFGISGEKDPGTAAWLAYDQLLASRHRLAVASNPPPRLSRCSSDEDTVGPLALGAPSGVARLLANIYGSAFFETAALNNWKFATAARLRAGDRGFVSWTDAKRQFFVDLKDRLQRGAREQGRR